MKSTLIKVTSLTTLLIILLGMMYIFYLIFEPFKIPTITPKLIPILNDGKTVTQGGLLSTDLNYCIYKSVPTITSKRLEELNTQRVYFFITNTANPKVGCSHVIVRASLPVDIPPGHYKITTIGIYTVNPLKTVTATFESEPFDIISK